MNEASRRALLRMMGVGVAGTLAGCAESSSAPSTEEPTASSPSPTAESTPEPTADQPVAVWQMTGGDPGQQKSVPDITVPDQPEVAWSITGRDADNSIFFPPVVENGVLVSIESIGFEAPDRTAYAIDIETESVLWSQSLGESKYLMPYYAISSGSVFLPSADGVRVFDAESGEEQQVLRTPGEANRITLTGSHVFSTGSESLSAFDRESGERIWSRSEFSPGGNYTRTFAVGADRVAVMGSDSLSAVAIETGETSWSEDISPETGSGPSIHNGSVFIGDRDRGVVRMKLSSGEVEWVAETESVPGELAIDGSRVYAPVGSRIESFEVSSGDRQWTAADVTNIDSTPSVAGGTVIVPDPEGERLHGLDRSSGDRRWTQQVDAVLWKVSVTDDALYPAVGGDLKAYRVS